MFPIKLYLYKIPQGWANFVLPTLPGMVNDTSRYSANSAGLAALGFAQHAFLQQLDADREMGIDSQLP